MARARGSLLLLVLLSCTGVFCDECVTYDFESDFDEKFTSEGFCADIPDVQPWELRLYDDSDEFIPFHGLSTTYMSPQEGKEISCISSYTFGIQNEGKLEINVYLESDPQQMFLIILQYDDDNKQVPLNNAQRGWNTFEYVFQDDEDSVRINFYYIIESEPVTILVDSFRYIPPGDDKSCAIYEETTDPSSSTTEDDFPESSSSTIEPSSSDPTSDPTTPFEDSTPESSSDTPFTIEASTPETSSDFPSSTNDPSVITTTDDDQTTHDDTKESYWNAVTITVLVAVIVGVVVLCYLFYKLGTKKGVRQPPSIESDILDLPRPITLPRVTAGYSNSMSYPYNRNNI